MHYIFWIHFCMHFWCWNPQNVWQWRIYGRSAAPRGMQKCWLNFTLISCNANAGHHFLSYLLVTNLLIFSAWYSLSCKCTVVGCWTHLLMKSLLSEIGVWGSVLFECSGFLQSLFECRHFIALLFNDTVLKGDWGNLYSSPLAVTLVSWSAPRKNIADLAFLLVIMQMNMMCLNEISLKQ